MKMGHTAGHKKEKRGSQDWYRAIEQANIDRITQEWAAFAQAEATALDQIVAQVGQAGRRPSRHMRRHHTPGRENSQPPRRLEHLGARPNPFRVAPERKRIGQSKQSRTFMANPLTPHDARAAFRATVRRGRSQGQGDPASQHQRLH